MAQRAEVRANFIADEVRLAPPAPCALRLPWLGPSEVARGTMDALP